MATEMTNIYKNSMGTISIDMKIKGMRKFQEFMIYPINKESKSLTIQSDTRIARVDLDGNGIMSKSHQSGAYFHHLQLDKCTDFCFEPNDWQQIVEYIGLTENKNAGSSVIKSDNSGAKSIFNRD